VTRDQLDLAKRAWKAFGSADPTSIAKVLDGNTSALPYLADALRRHLEEFPSPVDGLSRSEREALAAIEAGHSTPIAAFLEVAGKQESIFLGDIIFYSYLERLSGKKDALVTWKDGTPVIAPTSESAREFVEGELTLTPLGREVLAGNNNWHRIHNRTRWLGGVEIKPGKGGWRWDPAERELVHERGVATPESTRAAARTPTRTRSRPKTRHRLSPRTAKKRSSPPAKKSKPRSPARPAPRTRRAPRIRRAPRKKK
jgi:hypothetical protein